MRSVGDVQVSPDGTRAAYVVQNNDQPGRPYSQIWVVSLADGQSIRFGGEREPSSGPEWSPDGQWIAYDKLIRMAGAVAGQTDGTTHKGATV
jgi:Tol biopolymer transport system component